MEYRISVTLEQITPMLHFQWDQEGACLRASDVKPKLDRFVLQWLEKKGLKVKDLPADWYSTDEKGWHSLRYRLRFECDETEETNNHPLYFPAYLQGAEVNAKGVMCKIFKENGRETIYGVRLTALILAGSALNDPVDLPGGNQARDLSGIIKGLLPLFFRLHCFGTRSGKGFGSFEVKSNPNLSQTEYKLLNEIKPDNITSLYYIKSKEWGKFPYEKQLDSIYALSCMMKGGVQKKRYPGFIQQQSNEKGRRTEKDLIKQKFFNEKDDEQYTGNSKQKKNKNNDKVKYRYERAMLGLTDNYKKGDLEFDVSAEDPKIERFANPVRFKPCRDGFLVLVDKIPDKMFGAKFNISCDERTEEISTPEKTEFNLDRFVHDFLSNINKDNKNRPDKKWSNLANSGTTIDNCNSTFKQALNLQVKYGMESKTL